MGWQPAGMREHISSDDDAKMRKRSFIYLLQDCNVAAYCTLLFADV